MANYKMKFRKAPIEVECLNRKSKLNVRTTICKYPKYCNAGLPVVAMPATQVRIEEHQRTTMTNELLEAILVIRNDT